MTARTPAPPGKAAAPGVATEGSTASDRDGRKPIVAQPTHKPAEPACWLCPLPRCGFPACRVEVAS
jgi:hypothetical protein